VLAAIGSERGWTDRERDLLERAGFTLCSMGSRILRTETAATVASSIILDAMGYLQ
jgi:RsmE family RNA methyltransferase